MREVEVAEIIKANAITNDDEDDGDEGCGCGCLYLIAVIMFMLTTVGLILKAIGWMWDYVMWIAS